MSEYPPLKPGFARDPAFDERTEKLIKTLTPTAQKQARVFLQKVRGAGYDARIISGTRTYAEQTALFAKGRTAPGAIVTYAKAGESNHNFCIAWDILLFDAHGAAKWDGPEYAKIGAIGRDMGLEWGGDWHKLQDEPHFQCKTGKTVSALRAMVAVHGGLDNAISAIDAVILPINATSAAYPPNLFDLKLIVNGVVVEGAYLKNIIVGGVMVSTGFSPVRAFVKALRGDTYAALLGGHSDPADLRQIADPFLTTLDGHDIPHLTVHMEGGHAVGAVRELAAAFGGQIETRADIPKTVFVVPHAKPGFADTKED